MALSCREESSYLFTQHRVALWWWVVVVRGITDRAVTAATSAIRLVCPGETQVVPIQISEWSRWQCRGC